MRNTVGRYKNIHPLVLDDPHPKFRVVVRVQLNLGQAGSPGRGNPVGCAGHPARVGSAPIQVVRVSLHNGFKAAQVVDDCPVAVLNRFRLAGRTGGEVEVGILLGIRVWSGKVRRSRLKTLLDTDKSPFGAALID